MTDVVRPVRGVYEEILLPADLTQGVGAVNWLRIAWWNLTRALIITRREVSDMLRDWRILTPIVVLTVIFPSIANWGAGRMTRWVAEYNAEIVGVRLIPFLMMVVGFFPISFSLIIALETFVGEKERHSLEPLLSSPLTNLQLYIGKTLSSTIPPIIGSLLGITVYLVGVYLNVDYRPPLVLLVQVILLTIVQAGVMVSGAVIISTQVTSVRAANLLASFVIIPMSFLIQAEALIMFWARYDALWVILFGLVVLNAVLIRMGVQSFQREELLGNEIDDLDLGVGIKLWWSHLVARNEDPKRNAWQWYRDEVLGVLWNNRLAMGVVLVAAAAACAIGAVYATWFTIPVEFFDTEDWISRFSLVLVESGFHGPSGVTKVFFQNVRALAIASALAVFSFGVLMVLVVMLPFVIISFLAGQLVSAGLDPAILWASLLPHGIVELPAVIIAGAMALKLGACIIAPPPNKTIGEGWLISLAEATRLWFALILPLLILAAILEIYLTPAVLIMVAGG